MPTIGADTDPLAPVPAGGVLAGVHPTPGYAAGRTPASRAQAALKASVGHTHAANTITSGTLAVDRIPTSTTTTSAAVPRADDPRLAATEGRNWVLYDDTDESPTIGQAPLWNGTRYVPGNLPPAADLRTAGITQTGALNLAGDFKSTSTAASPRLLRTSPIGGHNQQDTFAYPIDATYGSSFFVVVALRNIEFSYDYLLSVGNVADGQFVTVEVLAQGGSRRIAMPSSHPRMIGAPVADSTGTVTVPQNRIARFVFYGSNRRSVTYPTVLRVMVEA